MKWSEKVRTYMDFIVNKRTLLISARRQSSGVTLKQCIYSGLFIIVFILMTYKATRFINRDVYNVINNTSSFVTSNKSRFIYSNEEVYTAIKEIRFKNCLKSYSSHTCSKFQSCLNLSERKLISRCTYGSLCQLDSNSTQNKTRTDPFRGCTRRLPRAIIIGAYKSGTRELIDFLAMNPLVVIKRQPKYEVAYFDKQADKGLDWYRDEMPFSSRDQITVEKSPSYFMSKEAPRRIFEMDKDTKLILVVRNPVDRTISHLTFEDFIIKEQYGNSFNNCLYKYAFHKSVLNEKCFAIKESFYEAAIERYLKYFPLEQIFIADSDTFLKQPCKVMKDLEVFLKVDPFIDCHNFLYNKETGLYCVQTKNSGFGFCYSRSRGRLKLQTEFSVLKNQLKTLFKTHNERFFELVRRRFDWE